MGNNRDSFAGPHRGQRDQNPEEINICRADTRDKPESTDEGGEYLVIQWHGGVYLRRNSWIMAEQGDVVDLEDNR